MSCIRVVALAVLCLSSLAHAAAAEVWPSKVKRLPDGGLEFVYDLRPVKSGKVQVDLGAGADEAAVAAFRKALPNETTVRVAMGDARLVLDAPSGLERAPLASSFASVPEGPFAAGEFDERPELSNLPRLHRFTPKLLPSADLFLWRSHFVTGEVDAALLLAAHEGGGGLALGRRALFERVLQKAVERYRVATGSARDGAAALAARLGGMFIAATGRPPPALRSESALLEAAQTQAGELSRPRPRFPPTPWAQGASRLTEAQLFARGLGEPFGVDRAGVGAVLTFLAILDSDPKLAAAYQAQRTWRDGLFGKPMSEPLETFTGDPGEALENLGEYLAQIGPRLEEAKQSAPLLTRAETPAGRFIAQLAGPEQAHAIEELTLAVQDNRLSLTPGSDAGWAAGRDAYLRPLLRPEKGARGTLLSLSGSYTERLARVFQALHGLHADVRGGGAELGTPEPAAGESRRIRLMVPPHLEVEPLPDAYADVAVAWKHLDERARLHGKAAGLRGMGPSGARALTLSKEATQQELLYRGLAFVAATALGHPEPTSDADRKAMQAAQKFLTRWRADGDLRQDARYLLPVAETLEPGVFMHSGVFGVGRREIEVAWEGRPRMQVVEQPELFETDSRAPQRYQVPVLVTGAVSVARSAPLDAKGFRAVCEKAGRERDAIEAALPEAMVRMLRAADEVP